ncbi:hypothetical protein BDY19DRAFT_1004995 [Irpex rosettiformis]|uniref:Uncharacterized protein n=1 Tax=Irpex rosettiformis TaxID=378272 RepID=A0ACB8U486_9APHY|nr:hypothetical protein BDY19DRAFT_1004995 [Irpex rosettiformis]
MAASACQVVCDEREYVASHPGRSQYSTGGTSACGLAALNCARIILQSEMQGDRRREELLEMMTERKTCENILDICVEWSNTVHLEVEDIYDLPIFDATLALCWSDYGRPGAEQFRALLQRLAQNTLRSAAVVITRPPEIICVLKIVLKDRHVFVTFDSHPRHKHPEGAAFIFHPSLDAVAIYLSELLRYDDNLLSDSSLQWQAQLLGQYSAHLFVAKPDGILRYPTKPSHSSSIEELLIRTSLKMLKLKAEIAQLREKNQSLESDLQRAASAKDRLERRMDGARRKSTTAATTSSAPAAPNPTFGQSPASATRQQRLLWHTTDELDENGEVFATRISLKQPNPTQQKSDDDSIALAMQVQLHYEAEDRQLRAQMHALQTVEQKVFDCRICMETSPEDFVVKIDSCGHQFCRSCMLQYIRSKLNSSDQQSFPILCPACTAQQDDNELGMIDGLLAQQVGLNEQELSIFTGLELSAFSVQLHCRGCQQMMFVDREEYDEADTIACPLPGCTFAWCKACSRSIEIDGPRHSCDGTSELAHLMDRQGWKSCPGCRTPTSKVDGCNHMTCIVPGCNTHFCYLCGENIVQSVRRSAIQAAVQRHYNRCRMFDIPN